MIYMFPMHDTFYRQLRFGVSLVLGHTKKPLKHQDEEGDWSWPQGKTAEEPVVGSEYLMIHGV